MIAGPLCPIRGPGTRKMTAKSRPLPPFTYPLYVTDAPRQPRRHRLRRVAKWTGAGLCALIFAAWLGSRWIAASETYGRSDRGWMATVRRGRLSLAQLYWGVGPGRGSLPRGWGCSGEWLTSQQVGWDWLPDWMAIGVPGMQPFVKEIKVPLLIPFAVLGLPVAWLFYRDRRRVRGTRECVRCGYDLSGLTAGAMCPECGNGVAA